MFVLGMRIWAKDKMIYPNKFSVMLDEKKSKSSIRTYIGNEKFESYDFMMLSSGKAINGVIFEKDIIMFEGDENKMGVVEYSPEHGAFICRLENEIVYITNNMPVCEIVGTVYEDKEFLDLCKGYTYEPVIEDVQEKNNEEPIKEEIKTQEATKENSLEEQSAKEESKVDSFVKENVKIEEASEIKEESPVTEETPSKKRKKKKKKKQAIEDVNVKTDSLVEDNKEDISPELKEEEKSIEKQEEDEVVEVFGGDGYTVEYTEPFINIEESAPTEDLSEPIIEKKDNHEEIIEEIVDMIMNKSDKPKDIELFVSSKCLENGNAGYCFSFKMNDIVDTYKGSETNTSSKRIELISLISALSMLEGKFNITIYSDSQYVIYPFIKGWIYKWQANNWWKNENDKVQNDDLWNELYELSSKYEIKWSFIKDASTLEEMNECNSIATDEAHSL